MLKINKIHAAILLVVSSSAFAALNGESVYTIKIPSVLDESEMVQLPPVFGKWSDVGEPYDCKEPSPAIESVNWGVEFKQITSCQQNRVRQVTNMVKDPFSGAEMIESQFMEDGVYTHNTEADKIGSKNYEVSRTYGDVVYGSSVGSVFSCETKTHNIDDDGTVTTYPNYTYVSHSGANFKFTQPCSQNFNTTKTVTIHMADGTTIEGEPEKAVLAKKVKHPVSVNAKTTPIILPGNTYIKRLGRYPNYTNGYKGEVYINGKRAYETQIFSGSFGGNSLQQRRVREDLEAHGYNLDYSTRWEYLYDGVELPTAKYAFKLF